MKKVLFIAFAFIASVAAHAQYTKFEPNSGTSPDKQVQKSEKKSKGADKVNSAKQEKAASVSKIEPKYAQGACPEVDGKVEWENTISCHGLSAQQIYDKALAFLAPYCKESDKADQSQIALVNPTTHEIGARIGEYVVFQNAALSLDRAMMHYTLCLYCSNGKCKVVMKSLSYKYEGKTFPAEEMLLDKNAINKKGTDFYKGGYKKFRTKTIDAKDALFQKLSDAINKK